jgi:hypothetical protein
MIDEKNLSDILGFLYNIKSSAGDSGIVEIRVIQETKHMDAKVLYPLIDYLSEHEFIRQYDFSVAITAKGIDYLHELKSRISTPGRLMRHTMGIVALLIGIIILLYVISDSTPNQLLVTAFVALMAALGGLEIKKIP